MDFAIVWTEPALADFECIIQYIQTRNPTAAESVRISILETVELLARFPLIGPRYERDRTGRVREILCGVYRIFYRVDESGQQVEILTVWHGFRSEPSLPD
ncbi:MAG: plasmid stabilization protein [Planctomycetaceae bacterium]|nr:plasmid stabilization protein [Planctomycetaceae bacterium]